MYSFIYPSKILLVIRDGIATSRDDLEEYFRVDPSSAPRLWRNLDDLERAGLIEKRGHGKYKTTALLNDCLRLLNVSLTALAAGSTPHIFHPSHYKSKEADFKSDILVFMPFEERFKPVYEDHLKPVASKLGLKIIRADDFYTTGHIVNEIWTALLETRFVIADCTDRNPNVFYEVGMAHVVGKPTLLITQNVEDVPFDLRHLRFLHYEFTPRGMKDFEKNIKSTVETIKF